MPMYIDTSVRRRTVIIQLSLRVLTHNIIAFRRCVKQFLLFRIIKLRRSVNLSFCFVNEYFPPKKEEKKIILPKRYSKPCRRTDRTKNHRVPNCRSPNCHWTKIHQIRNWPNIWTATTGNHVKRLNHLPAHRHRVQWPNHLTLFRWR